MKFLKIELTTSSFETFCAFEKTIRKRQQKASEILLAMTIVCHRVIIGKMLPRSARKSLTLTLKVNYIGLSTDDSIRFSVQLSVFIIHALHKMPMSMKSPSPLVNVYLSMGPSHV